MLPDFASRRRSNETYALHGLNVNVDFYSGAIYQLHCIKTDLYVSIFDAGRMPGWIIQCI